MRLNYVSSVCPFCGTGCGMNLIVTDDGIAGIAPYHRSPVNRGKLCTRGLHTAAELKNFRIVKPVVGGAEADLEAACAKLLELKGKGAEVYVSTRYPTQAIKAVQRLAKEVLGVETVKTFTDAAALESTAVLADIEKADVILVVDNAMRILPVTGSKVLRAKDKGAKVLYAGPECYTAVQADEKVILEGELALPANFTEALKGAANAVVLCPAASPFAEAAAQAAADAGAKFGLLYETANGRAAVELGCVPSLTAFKNAEAVPANMLVFAESPEYQTELYLDLVEKFEKVENLVVVASNASVLTDIAGTVIPVAAFGEYAGTVTSWDGTEQETPAAVAAPEGILTPYELVEKLSNGAIKEA